MKYIYIILLFIIILILIFIGSDILKFNNNLQLRGLLPVTDIDEKFIKDFSENGFIKTSEFAEKNLQENNFMDKDSSVYLKVGGHLTEVDGGLMLNTLIQTPECDQYLRGVVWFVKMKLGQADMLIFCMKDATDKYIWQAIK